MRRRSALRAAAAFGAAALFSRAARAQSAPAFSEEARRRLAPGNVDERERFAIERQRLLDEAEQQLEAGRAELALETFQRAAMMLHAPDTELGIVRALMAAGQYRRALAFCAHAAGAHRDQPAGMALYSWLLHVGGQEVVARRFLDEAIDRAPGQPVLLQARDQLSKPWPIVSDLLRQRPWRVSPYAFADTRDHAAPASCCVVGTGVLLADGASALVPSALFDPTRGAALLWLRNGLGQTTAAEPKSDAQDPDLMRVALRTPLPVPKWQLAPREPFAGSPGSLTEYTPDPEGAPSWPVTRQGFFAGVPGTAPSRPLGLTVPAGPRGGPVFDTAGRLAGIALTVPGAGERLLGVERLRRAFGPLLPASADAAATPGVGVDASFEAALLGALQVLQAPHRSRPAECAEPSAD